MSDVYSLGRLGGRLRVSLRRIAVFVPFLAVLLSGFVPLVRQRNENDFDWAVVFNRFHLTGVQFGVDVGYMYGPWGFIWAGYDPRTFPTTCLCWLALALIAALTLFRTVCSIDRPAWMQSVSLLLIAILLGGDYTLAPDIRLLAFPFLLVLYHFLIQPQRLDGAKLLLSAALGFVSLTKFTYLVAGVAVFAGILVDAIVQSRSTRKSALGGAMACVAVFIASGWFFWLLAGQRLDSFGPWLRSSIEITRGYLETMGMASTNEYVRLVRVLLALGTLLAIGMVIGLSELPRRRGAVFSVLFFLLLLLIFRTGVVRHDQHEMIPVGVALVLAPLLSWLGFARITHPKLCWGLCIATMVASLFAAAFSFNAADSKSLPSLMFNNAVRDVGSEGVELVRIAGGKPLRQRQLWQENWESLARAGNWPVVEGTVEEFPAYTPEFLARFPDSVFRPTLKSLAAYTPYLCEMNARQLSGPNAVDNLLVRLFSFEFRMPMMDDNRSWLAILKGYDFLQDTPSHIHLIKRATKRGLSVYPLLDQSIKLNEKLDLPRFPAREGEKQLLFAKIEFARRPLGVLFGNLYRPPAIYLNIKMVGGSRSVFRMTPANAADGFIIGPVIQTNESFKALMTESPDASDLMELMPASIAIEGRYGVNPEWYFGQSFHITIQQLVLN